MKIGIVGLGLIGGSLAAAFKGCGHEVYGLDAEKSIQDFAMLAGRIDDILEFEKNEAENPVNYDYIFLAVTVGSAVKWLEDNKSHLSGTIVIDCCGTKRRICREGYEIAKENNFRFIGGHPMAGKQVGGYKNSSADLFRGAMFAIVPDVERGDNNDISLMMGIQSLLKGIGFNEFAVMTPEEHDQIIAFTSQMAHLISNAYIKSDMADIGVGTHLSGGAFRDLTRVAYLDSEMWTELFMENKDNLLGELNRFIAELERYRDAISKDDEMTLNMLLLEGRDKKTEVDECGPECIECKLMI